MLIFAFFNCESIKVSYLLINRKRRRGDEFNEERHPYNRWIQLGKEGSEMKQP